MQTGSATSQPIGHYEFCQKYKSECNVRSKGTVAPRVTERGWAAIRQVNAAVNREITPVTDLELHGRDEVWSYPDNAGDYAPWPPRISLDAGTPSNYECSGDTPTRRFLFSLADRFFVVQVALGPQGSDPGIADTARTLVEEALSSFGAVAR